MTDWPIELPIVVDSREQRPLHLPGRQLVHGLPTGDYSVYTLERFVAVERKSLADLYGCLGKERGRFVAELERLSIMAFPALVVEAPLVGILQGCRRSQIDPKVALGSLTAWATRYRIPVWTCTDRREAAEVVTRILRFSAEAALDLRGGVTPGRRKRTYVDVLAEERQRETMEVMGG